MSEVFKTGDSAQEKAAETSFSTFTAATLWLAALTVCLFAAAVLTKRDASNRLALEGLTQRTAVGDLRMYPSLEPRPPEVRFNRKRLLIHPETETIRDSEMHLAGQSDDGEYGLYRPLQRASEPDEATEGPWYIKVAINGYVRATIKVD
jgi:hypothetical protein